jgi:hypothetical protein
MHALSHLLKMLFTARLVPLVSLLWVYFCATAYGVLVTGSAASIMSRLTTGAMVQASCGAAAASTALLVVAHLTQLGKAPLFCRWAFPVLAFFCVSWGSFVVLHSVVGFMSELGGTPVILAADLLVVLLLIAVSFRALHIVFEGE